MKENLLPCKGTNYLNILKKEDIVVIPLESEILKELERTIDIYDATFHRPRSWEKSIATGNILIHRVLKKKEILDTGEMIGRWLSEFVLFNFVYAYKLLRHEESLNPQDMRNLKKEPYRCCNIGAHLFLRGKGNLYQRFRNETIRSIPVEAGSLILTRNKGFDGKEIRTEYVIIIEEETYVLSFRQK